MATERCKIADVNDECMCASGAPGALLPHWAGHCVSGCVNVCFCSVGNADVAAVSVGSNKGIFRCFFFQLRLSFFFFADC